MTTRTSAGCSRSSKSISHERRINGKLTTTRGPSRQFFKEYSQKLEEAHPFKAAKQSADDYFNHLSKEEGERLDFALLPGASFYAVGFLADELTNGTIVGTQTTGGVVQEALQSPQGLSFTRNLLAQIERGSLHDEAAAQQVESFTTGEQMTDYLQAERARYQAYQNQTAVTLPLPPEQTAAVNEELQNSYMFMLGGFYESVYNGKDDFLKREFGTLQQGMQDRLNQIPEDSPEKREMLDELSDLLTQIDASLDGQ